MTRSSFVLQLLAAAAMCAAAPAFAQEAAAPAAPQAPAAAPAAAPAPAAQTPAPAAAAPAPAAQEPAPPPPVLPTTGDGAAIISLLDKVCVPIANGGDFAKLVKTAGLKLDSKTNEWVQPLAQKPFQISISDPGTANKGTCDMHIRYAPGWDQPIIDALNIWRFLQKPQLHLQRSDKMNSATVQRVSTTWDNYENQIIDGKMVGLILVQLNKPDGTASLTPNYDEAIVQYQVRKPVMAEGVVDPAALAAQEAAAKAAAAAAAAAAAQQSAQAPAAAPAAAPAG